MSIFGTGFGQSNPQQQPQQQQPNAFGQSSTFGGSGFGAFGQNNQQSQPQQPQTNPMFGNLASSTSNPSGGFGTFGGNSTSTGAFGQPKPAFGAAGGAFGSQPSAFGSTGSASTFSGSSGGTTFGASGTGGTVFGQPAGQPQQQQSGAFGSGGNLFGKPSNTGFGSTALAPALPTAGSSNPPYQEFQERDQTGNVSTMLHYQSISCMPAYRNISFEELRVQDYQQGRKTANSFGTSTTATPFGQPTQQQQPSTGVFGQPASGGAFGQQPAQSTIGFGTFGQPQQPQSSTSGFGTFGQSSQQQPSSGAFGAFGQPQNTQQQPNSALGAFGQTSQQQQQPQSGSFGAFGQQNQQNKGFSAFGQSQTNPSPFSAFGSNTNTNTATPAAPSLFGPSQQSASPFGTFGQQNQNQQAGNTLLKPSVFGQPSSGGGLFGSTQQQQQPQGGLFGQPPGQQQQQSQGGLFGQPATTGAFGQSTQPAQQTGLFGQPSGGGSLFGNTNQSQPQQQQSQQTPGTGFSSLFSKPAGGGIFGSTNPTPQNPNPSNPLFGGGGGGFGNTNQQQQQPSTTNPLFGGGSSGSLFGGKPPAPTTGGLFGNTPQQQQQPSGSLFGSATTQQQQPQQQSSLFGGSSLFGSSTQPQQQPSLTPSIDQPLPTTLPTTLPQLPSLASSLNAKKRSNVFADVAARSTPRLGFGVGLNYTPPGPGSKLRGFGASISITTKPNPFSLPPPGVSESKSLLSPDAFSSGAGGSLQLLGGARQSVKKLVLDKRVDEDELHRLRASPGKANHEVRFSPALSVAARERDHNPPRSPSPASNPVRPPRPASRLNDMSHTPAEKPATDLSSNHVLDPQEGEYWCLPTVADLQRLSFGELQGVKGFTVGRVGFGTIQFLPPVDLTSVPSIADIPGKIVTFEHIECVLYPDERLKPPAGEGLNVPARIKLDRCWALDKSTREPIKDESDPKHLQRLRKMKAQEGAEFVSFDMATGVWEFIVQEF